MVTLPELVRVSCSGDPPPTATVPKFKLGKENDATGDTPLPVRLTCCGLVGSLSAIRIVAARAPAACGVNFAVIMQLFPGFKLPAQVIGERGAQSRRSTPETCTEVNVKFADPVLVMVTVWDALVVRSIWFPKLRLLVESEAVWLLATPASVH